jgi:hypothetical protein
MKNSLSAILACTIVSFWWWSKTPNHNNRALAKPPKGSITNDSSATKSDATGKRLKIQLELVTTEDLKVKEGQQVIRGQLIANHRQQQITAPDAGSILRVRLLSRHSGLLKYEVVLLCTPTPHRTPTINY